tara:strand:+ start:180 stop:404 length:225 start_codon:yes stop_codon:yes gene_type:complete
LRHKGRTPELCLTVKRPEKRVDLTIAPEQQPSGIQVVEWVGLIASGFQFCTPLAAVFAEEVADLFLFCLYSVFV